MHVPPGTRARDAKVMCLRPAIEDVFRQCGLDRDSVFGRVERDRTRSTWNPQLF